MNKNEPARLAAAAVDGARLWESLEEMGRIGGFADGGVNRQAFTAEDAAARQLMVSWAEASGLTARTDAIGNLFLRFEGKDPMAAGIMTGSHLDSQPTGGRFDGAYGVLAGLEAIRAMKQAGIRPRRPVEVVAWVNEEGSRFQPGAMGSLVFSGQARPEDFLDIRDRDGETLAEGLDRLLASTPAVGAWTGPAPAAYVEAHIEQGPILENAALKIGVVEAIQGTRWYLVEVRGETAHAGTTPMARRKDALTTAVAMVHELGQRVPDREDTVRFTVGRFEVAPGSPNTVPDRVLFSIDLRHPDSRVIAAASQQIESTCQELAGPCQVTVTRATDVPPTHFDADLVNSIETWAGALGLDHRRMVSGAGHDAMHLARVAPTAMLFIPCERGISHHPAEFASPSDVANGARLLAAVLTDLAG